MGRPAIPLPSSLGQGAPLLGPWFSTDISLPAPDPDLSVPFTPASGLDWLPPARGLFSLHLATAARPPTLAALRAANGQPAFGDDRLIGLFRLLPEVEARLAALLAHVPSPDGSALATPPGPATRPMPRWWAIEFPHITTSSSVAALEAAWPHGFDSDQTGDAEKLAAMGLAGSGGALANGPRAASILLGPGSQVASQRDRLLILTAVQHRLWAFDAGGRAIDPGAVAAWLAYLATDVFDNLWAPNVDERTCQVAAARNVALIGAHGGAVPAALLARAQVNNVGGTATDVVRSASGNAAVTIGFSTAPDPDDAPLPRAVLVPAGAATGSLSLWPSGALATGLARDQARVMLLDVEAHLTGQPRIAAGAPPTTGATRRAAMQAGATTRIVPARAPRGDSAPPLLLPGLDLASEALVSLLEGAAAVSLVTPQLDRDHGPFIPLPDVAAALPDSLPEPQVRALAGGGSGGTSVAAQRVLMEFALDAGLAGAMLRLWPNAVDLASGRRRAADGGCGRVRADGTVSLVVQLAPGANTQSLLSAVAVLAHAGGARHYGELRFRRPVASTGAAIAWTAASGAIIACEQDRFATRAAAEAAGLLPGVTLVHDDGTTAALIDPASVPAAVRCAGRALASGDRVQLSLPAFRAEPTGSAVAALAAGGAAVTARGRAGVLRADGPGTPLPGQRALVSAAAGINDTAARAVLFPPPALARLHEIGPVQLGHPGAPATAEHIGVGADVAGPAAVMVAEALAAAGLPGTPALVADAVAQSAVTAPSDPAGAALWVATLRTEAAGVEGERALAGHVVNSSHPYPFDGDEPTQRHWYADHPGVTLSAPAAAAAAAQARAMARRALAAGRGLQEAAVALAAAFARAEDLVYIETPAIDLDSMGPAEDQLAVVQALVDRLAARPALRLALCLPLQPFLGAPADLARVRADGIVSAVTALQGAAPGRVALFCPAAGAGRTPRLASTLVIVDDMWGLVGSGDMTRRGLSFDASLALAFFDEQASAGRGETLRRLRRSVLGARLGIDTRLIPDEGPALVRAINDLLARGSGRVAPVTMPAAPVAVPAGDRILWNRDGMLPPDPALLGNWLQVLFNASLIN